ncbi:hypothetical protein D9M73_216660 [compost metagenome]
MLFPLPLNLWQPKQLEMNDWVGSTFWKVVSITELARRMDPRWLEKMEDGWVTSFSQMAPTFM